MSRLNLSAVGSWHIHFADGTNLSANGTISLENYSLSINYEHSIAKKKSRERFYITGKIDGNDITLYGCFFLGLPSIGKEGKIHFNQALVGHNLNCAMQQKFTGVAFHLSYFDFDTLLNGFKEQVKEYGNCEFLTNKEGKTILYIEFDKEKGLQQSIDIMHSIRCFFIFLSCNRVNFTDQFVYIKTDVDAKKKITLLYKSYSHEIKERYYAAPFSWIRSNPLQTWANIYEKFKEQIRVLFEIITHPDTGSERGLVICVHAIEGFFGIVTSFDTEARFTLKKFDSKEFDSLSESVIKFIQTKHKNCGEISKSFVYAIKCANNISLREKILQLMQKYLDDDLCTYFVHPVKNKDEGVDDYVRKIVKIRNYYAHSDPKNKTQIAQILSDFELLYNYKVSVFTFLYLLIAMEYYGNKHKMQNMLCCVNFPFTVKEE